MSKKTQTKATTRKNKVAKAAASNKRSIVANTFTSDGGFIHIENGAGESFQRPRAGDSAAFRAISKIGMDYAAARAWHIANPVTKPQARLANGITGRDAPHSSAALQAQAKERAASKSTKAEKKAAPKAAKNKAPARGADRDYTRGKTEIKANKDSWRYHMLTMITKHTNTAKAKAAHEKSGKFSSNKLDFNWAAAQGYITFAK